MEVDQPLRELYRELLVLLSDSDAQLAYEVNVPIANVPAELVCMWFDDLYLPDSVLFRDSFSPEEAVVLAEFNSTYDAYEDKLPMDEGVVALHASSEWATVMAAATAALDSLGWTK